MSYIISEACIACGTCQELCPVEAIEEGTLQYVIDSDICIECGTCEVVCPVEAIQSDEINPIREGRFKSEYDPKISKNKFKEY